MKKSIAVLAALAFAGAFWASAALAEGWRVGDFTDQATLADLEKAVRAEAVKFTREKEKRSGEKTGFSTPTLSEEATGWNG